MSLQAEVELVNEDAILAFTHSKRKFVVDELLKENKLPEDGVDKKLLIAALDGMDKSAIQRKRIKSEEKTANANAHAANIIAGVLGAINTRFAATDAPSGIAFKPPTLGSDIPDPVTVPGEIDINPPKDTIETFMASRESANT